MPDRLDFNDSDDASCLIAEDPMALLIGFSSDQHSSDHGLKPSPAGVTRRMECERADVEARIVSEAQPLWFLGTLARVLLDGEQTSGAFAVIELLLPAGASPPLHSHPQAESFYVLDGEVTVWVENELRPCRTGAMAFAPGGTPHSFRVESDTARMLVLSTPAGIEDYVRALSEPAAWPWLQPPPDGPRVPAERIEAVEAELGVVRHGPPPASSR